MKKRKIISIIITIIILVSTLKLWIIFDGKKPVGFEFLIFVIISTISYLFSLKVLNYLAHLKYPKVEISFVALFFLMLFIPMIHIDDTKYSMSENRALAVYKPFIKDNKINYSFGKDFDKWFSDRFFLRKILVHNYNNWNYALAKEYYAPKNVINKKTKWAFCKWELEPINIPKEDLGKITDNFLRLKKYCKENNIKLYVYVVPTKSVIYEKETPNYIDIQSKINEEKEIINNIPIKVIYPIEELKAASKNDFVFFKSEHHWTEYGAYIGYKALIKEIQKDFPQVKEVDLKDYKIFKSKDVRGDFNRKFGFGTTYLSFGLSKAYLRNFQDVDYTYYDYDKNKIEYKVDKGTKDFNYKEAPKIRLLLTGTSMNENWLQFLPFSFSDLLYLRLNYPENTPNMFRLMQRYEQKISEYKPDILVVNICAVDLVKMKYLFDDYKEE